MSAKRCIDEKISEIYDRYASGNIKDCLNSLSTSELAEFHKLEKTLNLVHGLRAVHISNGHYFTTKTLNCCKKSNFGLAKINKYIASRYFVSGAVAAVFAVVLTVSLVTVYSGSDTVPSSGAIAANEFNINSEYEKNINNIRNTVISLGGRVVESEDGVLKVQASISDYMAIKKELTLSAEDKVFLNNNNRLRPVGTASGNTSSKYIEEVITFTVYPKK